MNVSARVGFHPGETRQTRCVPRAGADSTRSTSECAGGPAYDPSLTPEQVARRLNVSPERGSVAKRRDMSVVPLQGILRKV